MSKKKTGAAAELLKVEVANDRLVVSIGVDALIHSLQLGPQWPMQGSGKPCKILDKGQFLQDLIGELMREEEDGATPLHRVFDDAALEVFEQGCESVQLPD